MRTLAAPLVALLAAGSAAGCFNSLAQPPQTGETRDSNDWPVDDTIAYRDLSTHPGCTTAGLAYPAATIPGYRCAAKTYAFPAGVTEDTSKPIVVLIHGNSDSPAEYERFPADTGAPMLAEQLVAAGVRTFAVDLRVDRNDDPKGNLATENAANNIDHGWATPIAQHLIESVLAAYPDRHVAVAGFSLGVTVVRDALRRLHVAYLDGGPSPWERLDAVLLMAGANHGVSTFRTLCGSNPTMRGRVACELGDRLAYTPTDFLLPLNGPDGAYEAPCVDGTSAYGRDDACGGNTVTYTTIVMKDLPDGSFQDEFVSQASAVLEGADNRTLELTDVDESGYFFNGLFKSHYGSSRSKAALAIAMSKLAGR
jgi:hypothetical protein